MRNTIVSLVLLFSLFNALLYAKDMEYSLKLSSLHPYVNEATLLEVNLTQIDHSKVMMFKFSPKESKEYQFFQVAFKKYEQEHNLRHEYKYLIYPKKSGSVTVEFNLIKSITNDEKVAYAISGDRDNVKGLEKEDIKVAVAPLHLEVKSPPKDVVLVGDFTLTHQLDKITANAFEPVNLRVELKGKGFVEPFDILPQSDSYRLFKSQPKVETFHSIKGTTIHIRWDYAISSDNDFRLPKVTIKGFNPKSKKYYELTIPQYDIKVKRVELSSLLDKEDTPAPLVKSFDWSFLGALFSYLFVFIAGFLMPRDLFKAKKVIRKSKEEMLKEKIAKAKTHKELLDILLLESSKKYDKAISLLEGVVYNGNSFPLNKIKSSIEQ